MDEVLRELGRRVRELRLERRMTREDLSDRSGVSARFLSDLEAGRANISVSRLGAVARALGGSAGSLLVTAEGRNTRDVPRPVSLLGLRGAGKSVIAPRLAARLEVPAFELDALVEEAAGLSLKEIFALHGEAYYRRLEAEALRRFLARHPRGVLATGGGIVTNEEAFALLRSRTVSVWLRADPADHWNRVVGQGDRRPMAGRPAAQLELRRILAEREPHYARAHHVVETSGRTVARCVNEIVRLLGGGAAASRSRRRTPGAR